MTPPVRITPPVARCRTTRRGAGRAERRSGRAFFYGNAFGIASHCLKRILRVSVADLLNALGRLSSRRAGVALVYHRIGDPQGDPARELVPALGTARFKAHLRYLRRRYRIVAASELYAATTQRRRGQRFPVAITFDDDLESHASSARPILQREGVTATFFVCGASLDRAYSFWWERLQAAIDGGVISPTTLVTANASGVRVGDVTIHDLAETVIALPPGERDALTVALTSSLGPAPLDAGLSAEALRQLVTAGFEIGFHTIRHDPLPTLDDDTLAHALRAGKEQIASLTGTELTTIAYPHGMADARVAAAARAADYESGFTNRPESVRPGSDPLLFGRLEPSFESKGHFALQVARALTGLQL